MRILCLSWCTFCALSGALSLRANPLGGTVVPGSGAASFSSSLGSLTINQTTPKVIINWQNFSIAAGETTRFVQPSSSAAALNRVTAANPSQIFGTLQANGTVYLINPSGILVGRSGQIHAGSFIGSTLDFGPDEASANQSFLSGAGLRLSGNSTAAVRNEGYISALDDVFLIGHTVQNAGSISGHTVGMAAGADIELRQAGSDRISVIAGNRTARPGASDGVVNSGEVAAVNAELKAAGGNIYALAINNGGVVRANSIVRENGRIILRADRGTVVNSGTLDASSRSGKGGEVQVIGQRVGLVGNSRINVSGAEGGGTVLVGGDFQGKNPNVPNAERTIVGRDARIKADALTSGDGGKVIVWSDEATRYLGEISARGAGARGNGGFVEVSGKANLDFNGTVNVSGGPRGTPGTVLLDPTTITIASSGPDRNGDGTTGDDIAALTDLDNAGADFPGANSIITAGAVNSLLTGNNNLAATASTTVNAAVTGSGNASLTLNSPTVNLNAPIALAGSGILSGTPTTVNVGAAGRIQNGVDVAAPGALVNVAAGTYAENISVSKGLTLHGAKSGQDAKTRNVLSGESIISGQVTLTAPNTTLDGFTVRDSAGGAGVVAMNAAGDQIINNYITANVFGMSLASDGSSQILVQNNFFDNNTLPGSASGNGIYTDFTVSRVTVNANKFTGNPEGSVTFLGTSSSTISQIDITDNVISGDGPIGIGNISVVNILRNSISGNSGHAIWVGGGATTVSIRENLVQNNAGAGLKFAKPSSSGIAAVSSGFTVSGNSFSGNADGAIVIDTSEGSRYTGTLNASGNWWGSATGPNVASVGFTGSGDVIIDTAGPNDRVDFSPWLNSANNGVAAGAPGFLGDFSVLNVSPLSPKANALGYIEEALGLLTGTGKKVQLFAGTYNDQVTIAIPVDVATVLKGNVTLDASTSVNFGSTLDTDGTAWTLTLITPSATFGGAVGNVAPNTELGRLSVSGNTAINGGIVKTRASGPASGNQTYTGPVTLGADTTLSGVNINLPAITGGGHNLAVNASGQTIFGGAVNGVNALSTDAPGNTTINQTVNAGSVTLNDAAILNGGTVTTSGSQNYNNTVMLGADTTLNNTTVSFGSTVDGGGHDLRLNSSGAVILNGPSFANIARFITTAPGSTRINGGSLNAGTLIDIGDQLILGANTALAAPAVTLAAVTGGANDLTINASGATTLNGAVSGVGALTTDGAGNTVINQTVSAGSLTVNDAATLNGGTVTTSGSQTYNSTVTLGADTTLNNTTVSFASTVNGVGHDLTLNSSGDVTLNGPSLLNIRRFVTTAPGSTTVNGGALNANTLLDLGDQLVLGADTVLTAPTVTLAGITGGGNDLTVNASGVTTFNGVVSAVDALTTDAPGNTAINSMVNAGSLTLNDLAALNGGAITTSGDQNYNAAVTLGADTTLSGANVNLIAVTGAGHDLAVNASGVTTFNGPINGVDALSTDSPGNTIINSTVNAGSVVLNDPAALNGATITTSGDQAYNATVTLGVDTVLNAVNATFANISGGGRDLQVNSSGVTRFNGAVNGVDALITDAPGSTVINSLVSAGSVTLNDAATLSGGAITTSGDQIYNGAVTLGADAFLNAVNVTLAALDGGGHDLTVNASGLTRFNGIVSGVDGLTTDAAGTTEFNQTVNAGIITVNDAVTLNGGTVTTSGSQTYNNTVTLGADTTLNNTTVSFASTVNGGGHDLRLNSSGDVILNGPSFANIGRFITTAPGSTRIDGGALNANTLISLGDQLILGANTALTAPDVTLAGVTGLGNDLNLNASGATTLNGVVSGVGALTTDAAGNTVINSTVSAGSLTVNDAATLNGGTITTSGGQTYNSTVILGADTTLNNTTVSFASTVNGGGHDLTLNSSGDVTLDGPSLLNIGRFVTTAPGSTRINGGALTANLLIDIGDQLIVGADTTLNAPAVTLAGVTGLGNDLTLNAAGTTTLNGAISGVDALVTDGAGNTVINSTVNAGSVTLNDAAALNGGAITTTGDQTYNGAVTLGADTLLTAVNVTLAGLIGAGNDLQVNASGVTTFNGPVSGIGALATDGSGNTVINQIVSAGSVTLNDPASLNGGAITTSGSQSYNNTVTLGADTVLSGTSVNFANTLNGNQNLSIIGNASFGNLVGNLAPLNSVNVSGAANLNGGAITTSGDQTYVGAVTLSTDTTLSGANLALGSISGGGNDLTANGSGVTSFNGAVNAINTLITDGAGSTVINGTINAGSVTINDVATLNGGNITTSGSQDYNAAVSLGANTTLSGSTIAFGSTLDGNRSLAVDGNVTFSGAVGDNTTLQSLNVSGTSGLNGGSVRTSGDQNYQGTVTLGTDTTLGGQNITLGSTVNGAGRDLVIDSSGNVIFRGTVTLDTLNILNAVNASGASLHVNDLFFNVSGSAAFVASDNRIGDAVANSSTWNAGSFFVSDNLSAKVFIGPPLRILDSDESIKRLASQLVPQVEFERIQPKEVELSGKKIEKAGIITRSSEIFIKPTEALTRSGDVPAGEGKSGK
jgi:filamentous hemagglutinin family protein